MNATPSPPSPPDPSTWLCLKSGQTIPIAEGIGDVLDTLDQGIRSKTAFASFTGMNPSTPDYEVCVRVSEVETVREFAKPTPEAMERLQAEAEASARAAQGKPPVVLPGLGV